MKLPSTVAYAAGPTVTVTSNSSSLVFNSYLMGFSAVFSEPVSGFSGSSIQLSLINGTLPTIEQITGSQATYQIALQATSAGSFTVTIPTNAVVSTSGGEGNVASSTLTASFTTGMYSHPFLIRK